MEQFHTSGNNILSLGGRPGSNTKELKEALKATEERLRKQEILTEHYKKAYEREHQYATAYRHSMTDAYAKKLDSYANEDKQKRETLCWSAMFAGVFFFLAGVLFFLA